MAHLISPEEDSMDEFIPGPEHVSNLLAALLKQTRVSRLSSRAENVAYGTAAAGETMIMRCLRAQCLKLSGQVVCFAPMSHVKKFTAAFLSISKLVVAFRIRSKMQPGEMPDTADARPSSDAELEMEAKFELNLLEDGEGLNLNFPFYVLIL